MSDGTGKATGGADFDAILASESQAFALLHRPQANTDSNDRLEILSGDVLEVERLADLPLPPEEPAGAGAQHDLLAMVPYRQIAERGFDANDDGEPILALSVQQQGTLTVAEALDRLPDGPINLEDAGFDVDDDEYADIVRRILADEIGTGAGANFVIKRSFTATITGYDLSTALTLFRRLLVGEQGAYWTFLVHTGDRTFVGATPERHVSVTGGDVVMNPISGTYRYPESGPEIDDVLTFLADRKEADELYMVVDEELKMMASVCDAGGRVVGPQLKEMARLAHTEYFLEGRTSLDVREAFRRTLFAPTVTGSPLENACRVIARYEPVGRGYYSGAVALIGRDASGRRELDSAILIRTAEIDRSGQLSIGVGATLVRESNPESEVAETWAKASGLLNAAGVTDTGGSTSPAPAPGAKPARRTSPWDPTIGEHREVRAALQRRNASLARYWLDAEDARDLADPRLEGLRAMVIDAEDTFTSMLAQQLRSLGLHVTVRSHEQAVHDSFEPYDLILLGPGPGDPLDTSDPRISALRQLARRLLRSNTPFLSVCLGHQMLSLALGLEVARRDTPNQGVQKEIEFFGRRERVGFYNTYAALSETDRVHCVGMPFPIQVSRDRDTGEVHSLKGPGFASTQFHPESLLTQHGVDILAELMAWSVTYYSPEPVQGGLLRGVG